MPWAKVDDGWWCHPKVMALTPAARGVWISVLSWSCQQRSPKVPPHLLSMVGGSNTEANALASAGLWEPDGDGWVIHDWADYQDRSLSEKRAEAGRKGGQASGRSRREGSNDEANAEQEAKQVPVPALPDPSQPDQPPPAPPPDSDPVLGLIADRLVDEAVAAGGVRSRTAVRKGLLASARTDHGGRIAALRSEHPDWSDEQIASTVLARSVPLEVSEHPAVVEDRRRREREALDDAPVADSGLVADAAERGRAALREARGRAS